MSYNKVPVGEDADGIGNASNKNDDSEVHLNKNCQYIRVVYGVKDGYEYVHIRICFCDKYVDQIYLLSKDLKDIDSEKRHTSRRCRWKGRTNTPDEQQRKTYCLWRQCECKNKTQDNSKTSSTNIVSPE
ncbi:hypothetical protein ACF0H5_021092 [Mactra antiquata]